MKLSLSGNAERTVSVKRTETAKQVTITNVSRNQANKKGSQDKQMGRARCKISVSIANEESHLKY